MNNCKQADGRFMRYLVLLCLLEEGYINQPTFDNVVDHKYRDFKGKIF